MWRACGDHRPEQEESDEDGRDPGGQQHIRGVEGAPQARTLALARAAPRLMNVKQMRSPPMGWKGKGAGLVVASYEAPNFLDATGGNRVFELIRLRSAPRGSSRRHARRRTGSGSMVDQAQVERVARCCRRQDSSTVSGCIRTFRTP